MKTATGFYFLHEIGGQQALARALATQPADTRFVPGGWFELAHVGVFYSPLYGKVGITRDDLAAMYRNWATETQGVGGELQVDYDHLGDDPQKPGDGRAAGWVKELQLRAGGDELWVRADWTRRAAQMIADGEYRFISPFFLTEGQSKRTGKRIGPYLRAAGLTNRPFLEGMSEIPVPAIAASDAVARRVWRDRRVALRPGLRAQLESRTASARQPAAVQARDAGRQQGGATAPPQEDRHMAENDQVVEGAEPKPGLTCPHCGAPVKHHGAPATEMEDAGSSAGPSMPMGEEGDPVPEPVPADPDGDGDEMKDKAAAPGACGMEGTEMVEGAQREHEPSGAAMSDTAGGDRLAALEVALSETQRALRKTQERLAERDKRDTRAFAERLIADGLRAGKLNPKLAGSPQAPGWARHFAFRDPAGFRTWLESAPRIVEMGERGTSSTTAADSAESTAQQVDREARALMERTKGLDYATATKQALGGNRALAERYDREMIGDRNPAPQTGRRL